MRNTFEMGKFREEYKTPPPAPEPSPPGPPVHPKLIEMRRYLNRLTLPLDPVREARTLRVAILDLAEDFYTAEQERTTNQKGR